MLQNAKAVLKATLHSCAIFMILSGIALAADRDVIIGYNKTVGVLEKISIVQSHGGTVKKDFHLINAALASLPEVEIDKMKKDPRVVYIVNNSIFRMADEYSSSWGVQYIGSQPVHDQNINGTGVKIAVLDTGIDYNHPDLAGNYKGGYDFVNNDPDPWDDNCLSQFKTCHGTHVSGIIAAEHNGFGVVGVAPESSIYAVKVLDGGGFGSASTILSGIEWAKDNGMNIISMSIQSTENNTAVLDAVNAAYNSSILLVAAGGNTYGTSVSYPAVYDSVIAVTAIDQNGQRPIFSPIDQKIEVAAPGVKINSTVQGGYGFLSGTSMAAPHVTGVAALIFSTNYADVNGDGKRDNKDVREIIRNTAFDAGIPGKDDIYGYGMVDASNATLGISAYQGSGGSDADLSITKDDGIDTVIAGDGNTYTYTITVKNNGPSDASNVIVSDTWHVGFTRGTVITSSGTCDIATSSTNFTCNLGNIAKDGTAAVTATYTVSSDTPLGNYINKAEVSSTTQDPNSNNNVAEDINIVYIRLTLLRTRGLPIEDAKNVSLSQGNYSIEIKNINLSILQKIVLDNGTIKQNQPSIYKFKGPENLIENLYVKNMIKIVFIPIGIEKSAGYVTIRRSS